MMDWMDRVDCWSTKSTKSTATNTLTVMCNPARDVLR